MGERLEGHIVLGHVDATGTIKEIITSTIETKIWIKIEEEERSYVQLSPRDQ